MNHTIIIGRSCSLRELKRSENIASGGKKSAIPTVGRVFLSRGSIDISGQMDS